MDSANVIPYAQPQIYRSSVPWKCRAVFIHPEDQYQRCVLSAEEEEAFEREEAALQFQLSQLRRILSQVARKRRHHILKQKVHRRGLPFEHQGGYSFSSSRATKMYLNIHCPHLHPLLNQEDGPQFGSNYIVGPLLYEEALDISEHTTVPQLNMIKLSLYSTGTVYILTGKLKAIGISTLAHSMVSVVHFTINDVTEELEVVFPSVNLRRIVGDVVAETNIDWDTNIIAILNCIDLKYYQFVIEVGAWNRMVSHCDLVLLKMFSAAF